MLYFCRRGQQKLHQLSVNHFEVKTDPNGAQYVEKNSIRTDKKPSGNIERERRNRGSNMYETMVVN